MVFAPLLRDDPGYSSASVLSSAATAMAIRSPSSSDGAAAGGAPAGIWDGALVWPSLTRRKAPWRVTPSVDLQDARDLGQRLGRAAEEEEVIDRLALVRDLVGEAPAAPRLVAVPGAARAVDGVADNAE